MSDKPANRYDNLAIDVQELYRRFPIADLHIHKGLRPDRLETLLAWFYMSPVVPLKYRLLLRQVAYRTHLDLHWFRTFEPYWKDVLGGRPLWDVHDFHFLTNNYRVKFQDVALPDVPDAHSHLEAWQRPAVLYQLLHLLRKDTSAADAYLLRQVLGLLRGRKSMRWLEFGCGTAPLTAAASQFFHLPKDLTIHISDIDTLAFHYACFKFRHHAFVSPVQLNPENDFALQINPGLDVIFCMTVFEHLNKPLETARKFAELLRPGGILVFDFILSEGKGLDTWQAVEERTQVLEFIAAHFTIVGGAMLNPAKTVDQTLAIRK